MDQTITCDAELFRYFDADTLEQAQRTLYKQTSCGAWMILGTDNKVAIGSIVEGLDGNGIEADPLTYPFTYSDLEHTIAWVEDRATELFNEVFDAEGIEV